MERARKARDAAEFSGDADGAARRRLAYRKVLRALDEAIFRLGREGASDQGEAAGFGEYDGTRRGTFRLGEAGGIAFSAHLPATHSEALFDALSDAAEAGDLDRVRRVRALVESRLRSVTDAGTEAEPGESPVRESPACAAASPAAPGDGLDWDAGYLQILAVLHETRRAREDGAVRRYWIMTGFLAGLLHWDTRPAGYESGSFQDAVVAACNEGWGQALWTEWETIRDDWLALDSPDAPEDADLLFRWQGLRLAAADRLAGTPFSSPVGGTATAPGRRWAAGPAAGAESSDEWSGFLRCERSTRRARNFGRRITDRVGGEDGHRRS